MADFGKIHSELDRAYAASHCVDESMVTAKWILFSDHHRGRKDGADDFKQCEGTYLKALDHYLEGDYTLALVGDVEEFWENPFRIVMKRYHEVLLKEKEFDKKDKLYRLWGNHDDAWRYQDILNRYLGKIIPSPRSYEAITINFKETEAARDILLVHGHQGSLESDKFSWISKIFVRLVWRNFQRLFRVPLSTPATDHHLKSKHDKAMLSWARKNDSVLICGHTHETVFMDPETEKNPNYFNTGCCSYNNGDITGIEIQGGNIRLIVWTGAEQERKVIHETELSRVLELVL